MTQPFNYPPAPHVRLHGPRGYADYASYRPWLRDEFRFRCVYCLLREQWGRVHALFALDHFRPVARNPELETDYENLILACASCNAMKGDQLLPDPLALLVGPTVRVAVDGTIHTNDPAAQQLIKVLGLNSRQAIEFRSTWIAIVALAAQRNDELYRRLMSHPDDLPDLSQLRPPGGNARPEGVTQSAFARRQRGELPAVY